MLPQAVCSTFFLPFLSLARVLSHWLFKEPFFCCTCTCPATAAHRPGSDSPSSRGVLSRVSQQIKERDWPRIDGVRPDLTFYLRLVSCGLLSALLGWWSRCWEESVGVSFKKELQEEVTGISHLQLKLTCPFSQFRQVLTLVATLHCFIFTTQIINLWG